MTLMFFRPKDFELIYVLIKRSTLFSLFFSFFFSSSITRSLFYLPLLVPPVFSFLSFLPLSLSRARASALFIVHYLCKLDCTGGFFSKTNVNPPRGLITPLSLGRLVYLVPGLIMTNITSSSAFRACSSVVDFLSLSLSLFVSPAIFFFVTDKLRALGDVNLIPCRPKCYIHISL